MGLRDLRGPGAFDAITSGDPEEIDNLIRQHGLVVELRRGVPCPCARVETYQGAVGCPVCAGLGRCFPEGLIEETVALVSRGQQHNEQTSRGAHTTGSAHFTFLTEIGIPTVGDQILVFCERHTVTQLLIHGRQPFDGRTLRHERTYPGAQRIPVLEPDVDALLYPDVDAVEWVGIRRDDGTLQRMMVDSHVFIDKSADGERAVLRWNPAYLPPQGTMISVRYSAPAIYQIQDGAPPARFNTDARHLNYAATATALYKLDQRGDLR